MTLKAGALLLALMMLAVLIAGLSHQLRNPRQVVSWGQVVVASRHQAAPPVTLQTRVVMVGSVLLEEVELPRGTWIDCAGDCVQSAREAGPDFWDAQQRNGGGR